jgi:hypothetical protein
MHRNHGEQGPHELEKSNAAVNFGLFLNQITNTFLNTQNAFQLFLVRPLDNTLDNIDKRSTDCRRIG